MTSLAGRHNPGNTTPIYGDGDVLTLTDAPEYSHKTPPAVVRTSVANRLAVIGFTLALIALISPAPVIGIPLTAFALALSIAGAIHAPGVRSRGRTIALIVAGVAVIGITVAYLAFG